MTKKLIKNKWLCNVKLVHCYTILVYTRINILISNQTAALYEYIVVEWRSISVNIICQTR